MDCYRQGLEEAACLGQGAKRYEVLLIDYLARRTMRLAQARDPLRVGGELQDTEISDLEEAIARALGEAVRLDGDAGLVENNLRVDRVLVYPVLARQRAPQDVSLVAKKMVKQAEDKEQEDRLIHEQP